ncbi:GNAT family N-acetyltransferase [Candidatus Bathyarchaeota archaeon A05DMB-2]|jgi:predicted N-acyltransferase|nr:GNAT family N-acetyltransferase [Candidatus Bathyarchaeota archaeon A05DMB-2]
MVIGKRIKVFNFVDEIGKEAIDAIADDGFFTYGWFKTLEASFNIQPFYLAVYDEDRLLAFAPCFIDIFEHYFVYGPRIIPYMKKILDIGNRLGLCRNRVLLCYSPFCYRTKISFKKNCEEKLVLDLISKKIDEICKKERIVFSSFLFVSEFDAILNSSLENFGYTKFPWRRTLYLDLTWPNFEAYLQSLPKKIRLTIRREIKKYTASGATTERLSEFGKLADELSDLNACLLWKYDKSSKSLYDASFFRNLNEYVKGKANVFVARKNGELIGYLLSIRHNDVMDCYNCGFKYDALKDKDFRYFNIGYYVPIKWAMEEGIKKIYYRFTAEKIKLKRGCKSERIYSFVKCHNKLLESLIYIYVQARHIGRKNQETIIYN